MISDLKIRERRSVLVATLVIPILVLCGLVVQKIYVSAHAPVLRLEIKGFDPVDLLRGHYIQYRYLFSRTDGRCICFQTDQPTGISTGRSMSCGDAQQAGNCSHWISGQAVSDRYKYFIDERHAKELDFLLRGQDLKPDMQGVSFTMDTQILSNGRLLPKMLYINDKAWPIFVKEALLKSKDASE